MKTFIIVISCILIFLISKREFGYSNYIDLFYKQIEIRDNKYEVIKLDSVNQFYLVYLERNDSVFKVLSKKEGTINCQSIQIGKDYDFKLTSWFKPEEIHLRLRMAGVKIENTYIAIERDSSIVSDLFTTENLIGKCYMP